MRGTLATPFISGRPHRRCVSRLLVSNEQGKYPNTVEMSVPNRGSTTHFDIGGAVQRPSELARHRFLDDSEDSHSMTT
jgi:hypothetical protein